MVSVQILIKHRHQDTIQCSEEEISVPIHVASIIQGGEYSGQEKLTSSSFQTTPFQSLRFIFVKQFCIISNYVLQSVKLSIDGTRNLTLTSLIMGSLELPNTSKQEHSTLLHSPPPTIVVWVSICFRRMFFFFSSNKPSGE